MGSLLVIVFWLWCATSIVILAVLPFYRRRRGAGLPSSIASPTTPTNLPSIIPASAEVDDPPGLHEPTREDRPVVERIERAPAEAPPRIERPTVTRSRSVADAVTGIRMPCDLAPLIGVGEAIDPAHVVFSTEGHRPDHVGQSVGDELERIGFALKPITDSIMYADRGADSVEVLIHPDPVSVMEGALPRFPTAPSDSVVVEFRVR